VTSPRRGGRPRQPKGVDPYGGRRDLSKDLPEISDDEISRRIGGHARVETEAVEVSHPTEGRYTGANRRAVLWRDSATILAGVILVLLASRFLLPSDQTVAVASPSPTDVGVGIGPSPSPSLLSATPAPTIGGVVPTGLHLDATPTPIPVITLPPRTPKPPPTASPGLTPKATIKPTTKPSSGASQPPPSASAPTFVDPVARFTMSCAGNFTVNFNASTSTAGTAGSITLYSWIFDDGPLATGTGVTTSYHYPDGVAATYNVILTITVTGGAQAGVTHSVPLTCL
jgi:hypothetical protein